MNGTLLSASGSDRDQWIELWKRHGREPFNHPDYVALISHNLGSASCAWIQSAHGDLTIPMIVRPLPRDLCAEATLHDAVSPYGYGGPFGPTDFISNAAMEELTRLLEEQGLLTFFGRTSLRVKFESAEGAGWRAVPLSKNVVISLRRTPEEQWQHYHHKVRKNVMKARRAGLTVTIRDDFSDISEFARLYEATMNRRAAQPWYYFGADFFRNLQSALSENLWVAEVRDDTNELVSAEIVLLSDRFLYSFLGGTSAAAFSKAPNDLLKHEVITQGSAAGLQAYVLGGGYVADDGVYRYKRAFDTDGVCDFVGLQVTAQPDIVKRLSLRDPAESAESDLGASPQAEYFPAYRAATPPK